jgi:hypothetical protein
MMTHVTVNPGKAISVDYDLPSSVPLTVRVSARDRVTVILTDAEGRAAFLRGETVFQTWVHSTNALDHVVSTIVPPRAKWYLILQNTTNQITDVEYEILVGVPGVPSGPTGSYGGIFGPTGATGGIFTR